MQLAAIGAHFAEVACNRWKTTLLAAIKLLPGDPKNDTLSKIKEPARLMNDTRATPGTSTIGGC